MTVEHDGRFMTYGETYNLPKANVKVTGQFSLPTINNFKVWVYPDIKSGHNSQSPHQLDDIPTTYWLVPHVIAHGKHYASTSKKPDHIARASKGHTEVYQLDNIYEMFYSEMNWADSYRNYSMVVPVFYPYDGRPNKALTFYVAPNRNGRQLG